MPPRRTHRKSRRGCLRCKARHIKCDESQPSCLNCVTAELSCEYRLPNSPLPTVEPDQQTISIDLRAESSSAAAAEPSVGGTGPTTSSGHAPSLQYPPPSGVNMLHLELLHHMSSVTCKHLGTGGDKARQAFDAGITFALDAPFLMHEMLAISALHLSTLRLDRKEFYSNMAAELQTHALSLYTNLPDSYNSENPIPVFLFSSFLGIHVLYDTLLFRPPDFSLFIERFVEYLRLHRGVQTIAKGAWTLLQKTDFEPLLSRVVQPEAEGNECAALRSLMHSADMSQASMNICQKAVDDLQWVFDSSNSRTNSSEEERGTGLIFAWPITMSPQFMELLLQKRPEALAILAHYAVLLHWTRDLWIIGDGGLFLIESIVRYLGSYWENWLALPMSILQEVDNNQSRHR